MLNLRQIRLRGGGDDKRIADVYMPSRRVLDDFKYFQRVKSCIVYLKSLIVIYFIVKHLTFGAKMIKLCPNQRPVYIMTREAEGPIVFVLFVFQ